MADQAQHAFLAEKHPTLHNVLPAIEFLIKEWGRMSLDPKYAALAETLHHGLAKARAYLNEFEQQEAYIVAMGKCIIIIIIIIAQQPLIPTFFF